MWQFIISGYIPGTSIQLTFELFSILVAVLLLTVLNISIIKRTIKTHLQLRRDKLQIQEISL